MESTASICICEHIANSPFDLILLFYNISRSQTRAWTDVDLRVTRTRYPRTYQNVNKQKGAVVVGLI